MIIYKKSTKHKTQKVTKHPHTHTHKKKSSFTLCAVIIYTASKSCGNLHTLLKNRNTSKSNSTSERERKSERERYEIILRG